MESTNSKREFHGNSIKNSCDEDTTVFSNQEQPSTQPIQHATSFSANNYSTDDHSYFDSSRRALPMMSTYNMIASMNMSIPPVKEMIQLQQSVLYPPNPNAPRPTTRGKPLGCKTVLVGGLPEKITEEILKEIFIRCGTVETIRMSKRNYCHIRFSDESFVENAMYFSGYRLKIKNKDEPACIGTLYVDYVQARDDTYDYQCKQRSLHQARYQEQNYRLVTPPIIRYTEHEASLICEKLKSEETFSPAASILVSWLLKGECSNKNAGSFYSMIRSTHNHARKLKIDKVKYEEQLKEVKKMLKKQVEGVIRQFTDIGKIYKAASLQKCWDHFTKAQQKNIEMWNKEIEELRNAYVKELIKEQENEIEFNKEDIGESKENVDVEQLKNQVEEDIHKLHEECLRCQLEDSRKEIKIMQSDFAKEMKKKDDQLSDMRQALQSSKKCPINVENEQLKNRMEKDIHKLQKECDSLRCELEASCNEVKIMHSDFAKEMKKKDDQLSDMKQAFQASEKCPNNVNYEQLENQIIEDIYNLKEEWDSLRCQLKTSRNEMIIMQSYFDEEMKNDDQISDLRHVSKKSPKIVDIEQLRDQINEDIHKLQEKCDSIRYELEAELTELPVEAPHNVTMGMVVCLVEEMKKKDNQLSGMQKVLEASKNDLLNLSQRLFEQEVELKELHALKIRRDKDD